MSEIVRGALPFGVLMLVLLVILGVFPGLALWRPNTPVRR